MNQILLLTGIVIVICILSGRLIDKMGVPSLLAFILLGMCFGVDGIFKISFDDYQFSELICSVSLIFIMFYGGFGTNIKEAKPVVSRAVLLSSAGVLLTAGITGIFIHLVLKLPLLESFLVASVIGLQMRHLYLTSFVPKPEPEGKYSLLAGNGVWFQ